MNQTTSAWRKDIQEKVKNAAVGNRIKLDCGIEGIIEVLTKSVVKIRTSSSIETFYL